ncbi:RepB family plasmid replication initiator protein [Salinivibrio sp. SS2]|uniref:RepB family plasmid replication initiator protein n=1 Tax=Salinivibrio sp. SS2 TaxID=1892894 RepID=UPI00084C5380|nr:RepB family plasmid replication initiator protein [Salinivibrio sp. DV]ODQ00628.1 hypothetical protein BGK46_06150 [Salinivibrio sp. DV]
MKEVTKQDKLSKTDMFRQANALTTAAYSLTRNEKRLVYLGISKIQKGGVTKNDNGSFPVEFSISEFCELFEYEKANASRDIRAATTKLQKSSVVFYLPEQDGEDGEKALDAMSWLTKHSLRPRRGAVTLYFNSELISIINKIDKEFTRVLLSEAGNLSNPHVMRLYETMRQWESRGYVDLQVKWMCDRYDLPKSYRERMPDFRRKFLEVAVSEINKKTDLTISHDLKEKKRGVERIRFTICSKTPKKQNVTEEKDALTRAVESYVAVSRGDVEPLTISDLTNLQEHIGTLMVQERFEFPPELIASIQSAIAVKKQ